ncbi:MAG: hypothetical protein CVU50_05655 [Candidatus Cloacimonetes bacterium HGW-Cloacimonetes-3]|jgi:hypothetical protein|nr:MAG: hypothetical protein CVU50_05655 [Candidatus Cloacimonetes bacterium HGW-Cloacimonetes-3]
MKHDYSSVMKSLQGLSADLLQVATYENPAPRCVIILEKDPPYLLESLETLRDYCHKHHLPFPLLINRQFVLSSLDSYPLEFLDIVSSGYQNLLAKEDLLSDLKFATADLRLQMERELKSKWLYTRLAVLEQKQKPRALAETLTMSINAIVPVLKGFCYLGERVIPNNLSDLSAQVAEVTKLNLSLLNSWVQLDKADIYIIKNYLEILHSLTVALDKI